MIADSLDALVNNCITNLHGVKKKNSAIEKRNVKEKTNAAKTNKSILDRKRVKILNTHEYLPNPIGEVGRNVFPWSSVIAARVGGKGNFVFSFISWGILLRNIINIDLISEW